MKFIAGPCVIESAELLDTVAERLVEINRSLGVDIIFKASFDKANRTSLESYRGVGMERGLQMLDDVRRKWGLKLLTDIHESYQAAPVGEVVDVIQIPAFLCRQTDLLTAAARAGRTINIKKAQFLSGVDMQYPYEKAREAGAGDVWLTERGIRKVVICGLAADYCVSWTALDAVEAGFDVYVVTDGIRAIAPASYEDAQTAWRSAGIRLTSAEELFSAV